MKTFISYRRADTSPFVDRLDSALRARFPGVEVSRDIDVIAPGDDYVEVLQNEIDSADLFLAVIGPEWAGPRGGPRRIAEPEDVVRREISWRLRPRDSRQLILGGPEGSRYETGPDAPPPPTLPVLVDGAAMPGESALPADIRSLANLNAVTISGGAGGSPDLTPLLDEIERRIVQRQEEERAVTDELDRIEREMAREARDAGPAPTPSPQLQVNLSEFSHLGAWSCTVGSQGGTDEVTIEFEVRSDNAMHGRIVTKGRGLLRRARKEPIEGRADLLFLRPGGADTLHPVIRLEGVRGGAQPFALEIPVERKLGQLFVGSSPGQSFALKQTRGHGL